jgi:hypothetical protein
MNELIRAFLWINRAVIQVNGVSIRIRGQKTPSGGFFKVRRDL